MPVLRALILLSGVALGSATALANPKGATVVSGGISITMPSSTTLDVNQSTNNGIIDWQSFNIATGEKTQFQVPAASSTTLNRVNVGNPSTIAGTLISNGNLILVNPSGIVFANGAQVDANSLLATTTDITNRNFLHGNMKFDIPSKDPNASIVNAGHITVAQSGLAALVAPSVVNSGVIAAKLGKVTIAGAETYTIDFYGDGLINFDIGPGVTQVPTAGNGQQVASLVTNTGKIVAPGGTVLLTADAAAGLLTNVIDAGGTIAAPTVAGKTGSITINGGSNGALVTGAVDVSGQKPGQTGGKAVVTGSNVTLASTANINASGYAGGGTVEVGGGPHGADPTVANAQNTTVLPGATINASATNNGNGGTVSVWSNGSTFFGGAILAQGGPNGGNGGWVETSGPNLTVASTAVVTASALSPGGQPGTWLLDPLNLDVVHGSTDTDVSTTAGPPYTVTPSQTGAQISDGTINSELNGGTDVVLQTTGTSGSANGDITVDTGAVIQWAGGASLTLNAAGNIVIQSGVTISGTSGGLTLYTQNGLNFNPTPASITIDSPISVNSFSVMAMYPEDLTVNLNYNGTVVTTAGGGQSYSGSVFLEQPTTLSDTGNGFIDFGTGTLDGAQSLTVTTGGTVTLPFSGTGQNKALTSLTVNGPTVFTGSPGAVTTTGNQTYNGSVQLGANGVEGLFTVTATGTNAAIDFKGAVDGAAAGNSLTADASGTGGTVTFEKPLGGSTPLKNVSVTGATTLDADVTTSNGSITFNSQITGGSGDPLVLNAGSGAVTLSGITTTGSLTTTSGATTLDTGTYTIGNGPSQSFSAVSTNGTLTLGLPTTFTGAVTLAGNTTLDGSALNNAITFDSTINGGHGLTVNTGTAAATFDEAVGGTNALSSLTVTGGAISVDGAVTTTGAISLTSSASELTVTQPLYTTNDVTL
ncbi:MAG TPA: filamentous hemagglutinin N-terminal domain-containing protein, partial [Stellaceae bacterium]|nr:filamentous hemagglutinin N-terminal domain-containing protein [Stellaceae bacterium]